MFDTYTTYVCPVRTYDDNPKQKYVVLFVMNADAKRHTTRINEILWFAVKTTDELVVTRNIGVSIQNFYRSANDDDEQVKVDKTKILLLKECDYNQSVFSIDPALNLGWPLQVILSHNTQKKSKFQYNERLTLHQAADTFKCLIRRTDF